MSRLYIGGYGEAVMTRNFYSQSFNRYKKPENYAGDKSHGRVDLPDMLERLGALGIDSLLVEGGQELNGSFFEQGLVDEYYFFIAPKLLGGRDALSPVGGNGFTRMADARGVNIDSIRHFGPDFLLHGYPEKK